MAQPRVFVSSTIYDLKYLRSSLAVFIQSLGYTAVLSETGNVAYTPDQPLDESCAEEVRSCDLYVLIIGGRYGSEVAATKMDGRRTFFEHYESITRKEYHTAVEVGIPIYILIERAIEVEYYTYRKNIPNENIQYAHVDSVNIFRFIDEIKTASKPYPMQSFEKYAEIEEWLRLQWAGFFTDLLHKRIDQHQFASLASQVAMLSELNQTMKHYLEQLVQHELGSEKSEEVISTEQERLRNAEIDEHVLEILKIQYEHDTITMTLRKRPGVDLDKGDSVLVIYKEDETPLGKFIITEDRGDGYVARGTGQMDSLWLGFVREQRTIVAPQDIIALWVPRGEE